MAINAGGGGGMTASQVIELIEANGPAAIYRGVVADEAAMLALTDVVPGQFVIRTDTGHVWTSKVLPSSSAANWTESGAGAQGPAGPATPVLETNRAEVGLAFDGTGTIKAGQLPTTVQFTVRTAGAADTGWSFARTDGANVTSSMNSSTGELTITAFSATVFSTIPITVSKATYTDLTYSLIVRRAQDGAAGGGGGGGLTELTDSAFATAVSGSTLVENDWYRVTSATAPTERVALATSTNTYRWVAASTLTDGALTSIDVGDDIIPVEFVTGLPMEPTIATVLRQDLTMDQGSDASHAEILITFNCGAGDVPDIAVASARFAAPDSNATVIKTTITGASAGRTFAFAFPGSQARNVFIALRGGTSYTTAAGATATTTTAVLGTWAVALGCRFVEVKVASNATGTSNRNRQVIVCGYGDA